MFRRSCGYSQKKVARSLGLADTSMLSRWEHGTAMPGTVQIFRLAHIYKALPHELFEDVWKQVSLENDLLAQEEPFNNQSFYL